MLLVISVITLAFTSLARCRDRGVTAVVYCHTYADAITFKFKLRLSSVMEVLWRDITVLIRSRKSLL